MTGLVALGLTMKRSSEFDCLQYCHFVSMPTYRLFNEQYAHNGPIRSVCIGPLGEIVTGSQSDSPSIRRWVIKDGTYFEEFGEQLFHDHWVTAVSSLPPGAHPSFPQGCIVTGCMDNKIRAYDSVGNPILELIGHIKGVISFSWTSTGNLISGSWDGTARVWSFQVTGGGLPAAEICWSCVYTLGPHENGVHVLGLPDGRIATTSTGESVNDKPANFQLRFWNGTTGQLIPPNIRDHDGPIRAITTIPGVSGFATCSNDGTVVLRAADGSVIESNTHPPQQDGSPPFILDCAALHTPGGMDVVSCGEDGSVCVWQGAELLQLIQHPASVWCAVGIPNTSGDFVTCGHDGVLRLFSRRHEGVDAFENDRINALHNQFEAQVEEANIKKKTGPSQAEIDKQTRWERRGTVPGKSEGQVMVFNKDGRMIAAQWSMDTGAWIEIGEVTGNGDGGSINGQLFDHVMPVEIDAAGGGVLNLQLGYNNLENPYDAAQRFIDQNSLPQHHLKTIADWIVARAGKQTPTLGTTPHSSAAMSSGSSVSKSTQQLYQTIPLQAYVIFDEIPSSFKTKLLQKVNEFNGTLSDALLSTTELVSLSDLIDVLNDTSHYHVSRINPAGILSATKIVINWGNNQSFPGYDLLRLIAVHPHGAKSLAVSTNLRVIFEKVVSLISLPDPPAATSLCALRFLGNSFKTDDLRKAVLNTAPIDRLISSLNKLFQDSKNKSLRHAASNVALNLSLSINKNTSANLIQSLTTWCQQLITMLIYAIDNESESQELLFRFILAIGTCLVSNQEPTIWKELKAHCFSLDLINKLSSLDNHGRWSEGLAENVMKCAKDVTSALNQ